MLLEEAFTQLCQYEGEGPSGNETRDEMTRALRQAEQHGAQVLWGMISDID
jgi:hypothetical protein